MIVTCSCLAQAYSLLYSRAPRRPRAAFQSPLWCLLTDHLDGFLNNYESRYRYQATHGTLPSYAPRALHQLTSCGASRRCYEVPNIGLTLFKCHECKVTFAVPSSCRCRLCSCCMSARVARHRFFGYPPRPPPVGPESIEGDIQYRDIEQDDICQIPPGWDEL